MADTQLRSAVVGCRIGALHAAGYLACGDTQLIALCDKDPVTLERSGRDFGVEKLYADLEEMLRAEQPDLLSIATAQPLHAEMTIQASEYHPRAILCEKPMASSMGEARAMPEACRRNGVRVAIDSDVRPSVIDDESAQIVAGSDGLMLLPCDFTRVPFGLKVLRKNAAEFRVFSPGPDRAPEFIARQIADLARWVRGEIETHRGDANVAIQTQEILMAIYESARTHSLVRLPLKTQSSPLVDAIKAGDLEVRYPGRYDIRYREQLPG